MGRPTKEEQAAKAAANPETKPTETTKELPVLLVGMWKNEKEDRFETILAACDPRTGDVKLVDVKNAGALREQAFNNMKKIIVEKRIDKQ